MLRLFPPKSPHSCKGLCGEVFCALWLAITDSFQSRQRLWVLTHQRAAEDTGHLTSRTTPYHPQGDPQPECFNWTLSMLATLNQEKKRQWSQHVVHLVHAYNSAKCDAPGYSSYFLMFGREARLPLDVYFGTRSDGNGWPTALFICCYTERGLMEGLQNGYRGLQQEAPAKQKSLWQETQFPLA